MVTAVATHLSTNKHKTREEQNYKEKYTRGQTIHHDGSNADSTDRQSERVAGGSIVMDDA